MYLFIPHNASGCNAHTKEWNIKDKYVLDTLSIISLVNRRIDLATEARRLMGIKS